MQANADNKNIALINTIDRDVIAHFETKSMSTVFRNLISNAIKFTPVNGTITFSCKADHRNVYVTITDSGVGMSDEVIEKIFKKNEHYSDLGTNEEKGTGLGLHVIKDFVKKNNGEIVVESTLGKGTSISIILRKTE